MLEGLELYAYKEYVKPLIIEDNGEQILKEESLEKLQLTKQEKEFITYIINKLKIRIIPKEITQKDRSRLVGNTDYGDIEGHDLGALDKSKTGTVAYSPAGEKIFENYEDLDQFLEKKFIPTYIVLKSKKNANGEVVRFPSIRLNNITALKLSEDEFKHTINFLKEQNIRVGGKNSTLAGEFDNYDYMSTYKDGALPKSVSKDITTEKFIRYQQTKDKKIREEIITDNIRLVSFIVVRYSIATGIDKHELESFGYEGLILAVDTFKYEYGYAFSTYACACIKDHILKGIQKSMVKGNKFYFDYLRAKAYIEKNNKTTLSEEPELIDNVIDFLVASNNIKDKNNNVKTAKMKIHSLLGNISLDDQKAVEELNNAGYLIDDFVCEEKIMEAELKELLKNMINELSPKLAEVIMLRFGFYDNNPKTLDEIAEILGYTRHKVRKMESKALNELRSPFKSKKIKDFAY